MEEAMRVVSFRSSTSSGSGRCALQAGQATFEFALMLLFVIVMLSALYQALHFELDAFNRISLLRYKVMQEAHDNQPSEAKTFVIETMEFQPIYKLTPVLLITQMGDDPSRQYGPKRLHFRKGTKYTEPLPISLLPENGAVLGLLIVAGVGTNEYKEDSRRFRDNIRGTSGVWVPAYLLDQ
jgi:hypothetical protein